MKITTEQNQHIRQCATATADLSARLAAAGVLCFYAGSDAIAISVPLLIGSATAGEMTDRGSLYHWEEFIETNQRVADSISPHLPLTAPTSEQVRHESGFQQVSGKWDQRSQRIL